MPSTTNRRGPEIRWRRGAVTLAYGLRTAANGSRLSEIRKGGWPLPLPAWRLSSWAQDGTQPLLKRSLSLLQGRAHLYVQERSLDEKHHGHCAIVGGPIATGTAS